MQLNPQFLVAGLLDQLIALEPVPSPAAMVSIVGQLDDRINGAAALKNARFYIDPKENTIQASINLRPGEHFTYAMTLDAGPTRLRGS